MIGILGAGQLSRMLALSTRHMGLEFTFYGEQFTRSIEHLGNFIQGSYSDYDQLRAFSNLCDVITFETENIPYQTVEFLESLKPVHPNSKSLKMTQDKIFEKSLFSKLEIPTPNYQILHSLDEANHFGAQYGYPFIIKKCKDGYDGKGLTKINNPTDLIDFKFKPKASICEQYVKYDREISIIAINSVDGQHSYYDICQNTHRDGILIETRNQIDDPIFPIAKEYIDRLMNELNYVGCMTLELFQVGQTLLANEIAPRVHNSGHWTIEGAFTSQFENHIRAISGLPLGNTSSRNQVVMNNIIGSMLDLKQQLTNDLCFFHDYQKEPRPGRKLGHFTTIIAALPKLIKVAHKSDAC
ncbi:MAG: 5-(carboxyamino)imidazole ribonucleotide synthase [Gammaproteobacteria bacterium]